MTSPDEIATLWQRYLDRENRGERGSMMEALNAFVERMEQADADIRAAWVTAFLEREVDNRKSRRVRSSLFQRVLFPELKSRYLAGDARACRWLAELSHELFRWREGWAALGWPGEVNLWKEAYRRDKTAEGVRSRLVDAIARFIRYTLHELPTGVLYGNDGATLYECKDLLTSLAQFRALLTPEESETFRELVDLASFHYASYAEYLAQSSRKGYSKFLAEQGRRANH